MARLKLITGLSYSYGDLVSVTKTHPFCEVEDEAVVEHLVSTGAFKIIDGEGEEKSKPESVSSAAGRKEGKFYATLSKSTEDPVGMPKPEKPAKPAEASKLDKMNVEELRKYADDHGIRLGASLKTKKAIIKAIEDAEEKAAAALRALRGN